LPKEEVVKPAMATTATVSSTVHSSRSTWIGLCIALFALPAIREVFRLITLTPGTGPLTARELLMLASVAALLLLVRRWEKLPLASVGLGTSAWWKSGLWGLLAAIVCGGAAVILVKVLGLSHEGTSATFDRSPLWLVVLIMFRAGIAEELFYRGYAIERLQAMGLGRVASAAIPLAVFAAGHYTGGMANMLIALVMGAILAGIYLWRRDLVTCIVAHTLVDLVANVLPRLGS
jgi:membrane protease YdiL (CAAX protease family)